MISKEDLAAIINKRLDGVVPKASIYDAINIICDDISDRLQAGESIAVNNFGILDTYTYHGHDGMDISSGEVKYIEPFVNVKFIPHDNLVILLNHKKKNFKA
jgi:nucleoid DNA-binding protein